AVVVAEHHADALAVLDADRQLRIVDRHDRGRDRIAGEVVHALEVLRGDPASGIEVLHLAADAALLLRHVEHRDRADARSPRDRVLPDGLGADPDGRDTAQPGDDGSPHTSTSSTRGARSMMNSKRGATSRPMRVWIVCSVAAGSAMRTRSNARRAGSSVVSFSVPGFISPSPLKRCTC